MIATRIVLPKKITSLFLFYFIFTLFVSAHEEPAKTLKEKSDKEASRNNIFKSKIKTATVWKFVVDNGKESTTKNKAFVMGYDKNGYYIFIEAYKNDSLIERDEYAYSANGDMLSEIDYSSDGKILEKNLFTFNNKGYLSSGESKNEIDSLTGYFYIMHCENEKCIYFIKHKQKDSLEYKLEYRYPDDFDKSDYIEACKYDSKSKLIMKVEKEYNPLGLQTKKTIFDSDRKLSYLFLYEYDNAGNNNKIIKKMADGSIEWEDYYTYDNNGNCTELKSYDKKGILKSHLVYEFELYK